MSSEKCIDMKWFEGGKQSDYKKRTRNGIEDLEIGDLKKNRNQLKIDYEKNEGRQEQKVLASPLRINRMDKDKI